MKKSKRYMAEASFLFLLTLAVACDEASYSGDDPPQGSCIDYNTLRNPYFGDIHVHTAYSIDAVQFGTANDPDDAYAFARGEPVGLAPYDENNQPTRTAQLTRKLDFAAVTDHSEFLAEASVCFEGETIDYWSPWCIAIREWSSSDKPMEVLGAFLLSVWGLIPEDTTDSSLCRRLPDLCTSRTRDVWRRTQDAAERNYDRTPDCQFTTFVAYEYSGSPMFSNLHRNIIFRGSEVPDMPVSYTDAPDPELLWDLLDSGCNNNPNGCQVLSIPHNSNIGGGRMFVPYTEDGLPYTESQASLRARMEPLVELYQHKGASECTSGSGPLASEDELCSFELLVSICTGSPSDPPDCRPLCSSLTFNGGAMMGRCAEVSDFVRPALQTGLVQQKNIGVNPFKLGFIGSTDTHSAIPGATEEDTWQGHIGAKDATLAVRLSDKPLVEIPEDNPLAPIISEVVGLKNRSFSPGGLAVVWAEENSRNAIFDSMRRRETYATSGTRIIVRFFGGWDYPTNLCEQQDLVAQGYKHGVPMGGDLPRIPQATSAPVFVLSALSDAGTAEHPSTPLQRIQIIKGWTETANGQTTTKEKVFEVGGNPGNGASVDPDTCEPTGTGYQNLCRVWQDPEFDPDEAAFYYARVVENPSCRWSARQCLEEKVDCSTVDPESSLAACCDGSIPTTIQERAWTSPIWYTPKQMSGVRSETRG